MARDRTLYEAWMASKASQNHGGNSAGWRHLKVQKRDVEPAVLTPRLTIPQETPQPGFPVAGLLQQLKGVTGFAMGMGGAVVLIAAFMAARMYGPSDTVAATAVSPPASVQPAPAAVPAAPVAVPSVAAPQKVTPARTQTPASEADNPWAKLLNSPPAAQ